VYGLLVLGVGAPELSPLFLIAALVLGVIALRGQGPWNRIAAVLSLATVVLAAIPLAALPSTVRDFDARTASLPSVEPASGLDEIAITRGIVFAEPSGAPLTLDIYRPVSDRLFPVIIKIYGGAWRSGAPADNADFAATLARRGYLVVAIDYRHTPQWRWPAQINDVRAGIEWVIAHAGEYNGDSDHIALLGQSSGAQLALVAGYTSDRIAAVVSIYGPTDLAEGWRRPPSPDPLPVRPTLEAFLGGTPDQVPQLYQAASPVSYVAKNLPPTLLVHGARDHIVEARFGRELDARLTAAGASSIYLEVPWAEHAFDLVPGLGYRVMLPYIERFLAAQLNRKEPAP
jgi:acetyl esterase/lipase